MHMRVPAGIFEERRTSVNDIRLLQTGIAKVSPGGRGGPGPDKLCDTKARAKFFRNLGRREATGLETTEYNCTPYVNPSPI